MSWLRVVTYQLPEEGAARDDALELVKTGTEAMVRVLEQQPGFGGAYWGESPEEDTVSAVTHWSSLEAIQAADGALAELRAVHALARGISVLEVHNVGLFAVPAISMWLDDDDGREPPARRDAYLQLHPSRFARWRR
jgi:heme-degrading monooxygenase HmoA